VAPLLLLNAEVTSSSSQVRSKRKSGRGKRNSKLQYSKMTNEDKRKQENKKRQNSEIERSNLPENESGLGLQNLVQNQAIESSSVFSCQAERRSFGNSIEMRRRTSYSQ
jgi:hypothetical protein